MGEEEEEEEEEEELVEEEECRGQGARATPAPALTRNITAHTAGPTPASTTHLAPGMAQQVVRMKPKLKPPGTGSKRLKLK